MRLKYILATSALLVFTSAASAQAYISDIAPAVVVRPHHRNVVVVPVPVPRPDPRISLRELCFRHPTLPECDYAPPRYLSDE